MKSKVAPIIRKYPYPYKAMLAICSDLDETPDKGTYFEIMKYLNTSEMTRIGKGVGLEVGNTIYFDMPEGQFSYWGTDDHGRDLIHKAIRSGHIDCLHSFGDRATTLPMIQRSLRALDEHHCRLEVWVDHAQAISNFDSQIMYGQGDQQGSDVYHADITWRHGVRYIWKGRVTSVIGQDVRRDLRGIFNISHPWKSSKTVGKEFLKGGLGQLGSKKYHMHSVNEVLREMTLSGGQPVYEFMRSNPHYGGVSCGETAQGIPEVLTEEFLDLLLEKEGTCILYTHLGKIMDRAKIFNVDTRRGFELLSARHKTGKILVTTTRRLLGYVRAMRECSVQSEVRESECVIKITTRLEMAELAGLTIYVPRDLMVRLEVNGAKLGALQENGLDETGLASVTIPWNKLIFPRI